MNLDRHRRWDAAICIVVALLSAWATARHPYAYYTTIRWAVCGTGVYMAWRLYKSRMIGLALLFACSRRAESELRGPHGVHI